MIKLLVIGNLGKDAIVNQANGKSVINFNVAHTESFTTNGEKKQKTIWVECAYWTDKTGIAPYLKKGTQVYVEGQPEVKTYPKNDGTTGVSMNLRVGMVQLLGSKDGGGNESGSTTHEDKQTQPAAQDNGGYKPVNTGGSTAGEITEPVDDLPF